MRGETASLTCYSDADYGNELNSRRSTTGYCIRFMRGPITYRTSKQPTVSLSSTEAEFIALTEMVRELYPLRLLLDELIPIVGPRTVFVDNISTIKIAANGTNRQRTKHIDIREKRLSEKIEQNHIKLSHDASEAQEADILTKPLQRGPFERNRRLLMSMAILSITSFI